MKFARLNDVVLHYQADEPGPQTTLVFSNSLGTDFRIWHRVVEILGRGAKGGNGKARGGFRMVRYDKRGHGLSEAPPGPYAMDDHVGDLAALLDHLGVRGAVVVGLSVGGMIAQGLAAARPELLRGLVLCDTAQKIGPPEMWDQRIAAIRAEGIASMAEPILERWFTAAFRRDSATELAGWRAMLTRTPVEGYLGTAAAIRDADLTETTRAIALPTLCLVGEEDGSTSPDLVHGLAELIAGARFEVIAGAGHLPCIEQPERVAALIAEYLGALAPAD